jgi:hypothetical protein
LAASGLVCAQAPGFVEGNLKIVSFTGVKLGDDDIRGNNDSEAKVADYAKYPLVILSSDGQKEIKRFTADADGHYRITLPSGDYVLDMQRSPQNRARAAARPFTVRPGETVEVNFVLGPGFF